MKDFLCGGYSRQMTIITKVVAIIEDLMPPHEIGIDTKYLDASTIDNIFDEEMTRYLVANASMFLAREACPKLLCTKIDQDVIIPRVVQS